MQFYQRSFWKGNASLEIRDGTLVYERRSLGGVHRYQLKICDVSPVVEEWSGSAMDGYAGAGVCAFLAYKSATSPFGASFLVLSFVLTLLGFLYFLRQSMARTGSFYILRSISEPDRVIWILKTKKADAFIQQLKEENRA